MTPAQQLSKVRDVSEQYANSAMTPEQFVERVFNVLESAPEGEAAGAGEAVAHVSPQILQAINEHPERAGIIWRNPTEAATVALYAAPKASAQALTERNAVIEACALIADLYAPDGIAAAAIRVLKNALPAPARMNDDKQEGGA